MSEQWMGLHNHGWHGEYSLALNAAPCMNPKRVACFDEWCAPDAPCRCCLAAEVEALRAQVQRVRELPILGKAPQGNTALRGYNDGWNSCRMATLRALDGDSDE